MIYPRFQNCHHLRCLVAVHKRGTSQKGDIPRLFGTTFAHRILTAFDAVRVAGDADGQGRAEDRRP